MMKPFNLEAALAGDLVLLRNGETAKVGACNASAAECNKIIGWFAKGGVAAWGEEGKYSTSASMFDIIGMAPKKTTRTGWINVYKNRAIDYLHSSKSSADREPTFPRLACLEITYEFEEE